MCLVKFTNNAYTTSPKFGCFDTFAPLSNNIAKKVPASANYGYMIYGPAMSPNDALDCSSLTLRTLEFHI